MFWALLAWYFFGGGAGGVSAATVTTASVGELRESVRIVVEDPARSAAATAILDQLAEVTRSFEKAFSASGRKLSAAYRDYDEQGETAATILAELEQRWAVDQQRALDLRYELKDALTREEWAALFGAPAPHGDGG